jgi:hypothetical protein
MWWQCNETSETELKVETVTEMVTNDCQSIVLQKINSRTVWPISIKGLNINKKRGRFTQTYHQVYWENPHLKERIMTDYKTQLFRTIQKHAAKCCVQKSSVLGGEEKKKKKVIQIMSLGPVSFRFWSHYLPSELGPPGKAGASSAHSHSGRWTNSQLESHFLTERTSISL